MWEERGGHIAVKFIALLIVKSAKLEERIKIVVYKGSLGT